MKIVYAVISIFSAYGIYAAVMLNEDAKAAAVVEAAVCGVAIYKYLTRRLRHGGRDKNRLQIFPSSSRRRIMQGFKRACMQK